MDLGSSSVFVHARLSPIQDNRIDLCLSAPFSYDPIQRVIASPHHSIMRAHGAFLSEGKSDIGLVRAVFLQNPRNGTLGVPMTVATTKIPHGAGILGRKRVILFPICDPLRPSTWMTGSGGQRFGFNLDHISFNSDKNGRIWSHLTGPKVSSKQVEHRKMISVKATTSAGILLGFMILDSPDILDPTGILHSDTSWACNDQGRLEMLREAIPRATNGGHPIITLPLGAEWEVDSSLVIAVSISDEPFDGVYSPDFVLDSKVFKTNKKAIVVDSLLRTRSIPIGEGLYLNVTTFALPWRAKHPVFWMYGEPR